MKIGSPSVSIAIAIAIAISISLSVQLTVSVAEAQSISAIHQNNAGVKQIEKEKPREAEMTFLNAMADDPFNPEIHYNLGTAYLLQKKFDRAQKEFQTVLRTPQLPPEIAFTANFNAAWAAAEQKNIDLALDFYQAALAVKPDSIETKKNIELLLASQSGQNKDGQGEGQGGKPDQENKDGQGQQPQNDPKDGQDPQQKPKNGQNFSKDELKKIFEELERQEQKVRGLEYGTKGGKEKGPGKDW